jgi:hypothetical protein
MIIIFIVILVSLDFGFICWFNYSFPIDLQSCLYVNFACHLIYILLFLGIICYLFHFVMIMLFCLDQAINVTYVLKMIIEHLCEKENVVIGHSNV